MEGELQEWNTPGVSRSLLRFAVCRRVEQPAQQIAVTKQVPHDCVATSFQHACNNAGHLHHHILSNKRSLKKEPMLAACGFFPKAVHG